MKKRKIQKDVLVLSILTFLAIISWIAFDVYRALTKTEIPKVLKQQIAPLDPSIDSDLLIKLKSRETITSDELGILRQKKEETEIPSTSSADLEEPLEEE